MIRVRHWIEASVAGAFFGIARWTPRRVLLSLGSVVGRLGYYMDRRHRRIALENLHLAYGDQLDERDARQIVLACWTHFGRIVFDSLSFPRLSASSLGSIVHYDGLNHIREAYARGKGVLLFSGHFGHWELVALMQGYLDLPLALVIRPLDNPILEARLVRIRRQSGNVIIYHRGAVREMVKALRRGRGVAIVIDQDARNHGVFVPFFGRLASTTPSLASLALKTGASVVPVFSVPGKDGSYRVIYEPPVEVKETGNPDGDALQITAECTAIIERWVRRHPELWLWMHRRWKTPPPLSTDSGENDAASYHHGP